MNFAKDPKTTITGLVGGSAMLLATFGFQVPQDVQNAIIAVAFFIACMLGADSKNGAA